jgi:hypothetical protein
MVVKATKAAARSTKIGTAAGCNPSRTYISLIAGISRNRLAKEGNKRLKADTRIPPYQLNNKRGPPEI